MKKRYAKTALAKRSYTVPAQPLSAVQLLHLDDDVVGSSTSSGVRINRKSSLTYDAVWRGLNKLTGDVAKLPLHVYRRESNGGRVRDTQHPAYRLLRYSAGELTAFQFWRTIMGHCILEGSGYALIVRDGRGDPTELVLLDPCGTYAMRSRVGDGPWRMFYAVQRASVQPDQFRIEAIPAEDVLHIRGLAHDGLNAYKLWEVARDSWAYGLAAQNFGAAYFKNGARPSIVLQYPTKLAPEAAKKLRETYAELLSGQDNWHKPVVLWEGMQAITIPRNAKDAQLEQLREHELRRVANWFGMPAYLFGAEGGESYASIEAKQADYAADLDVWLRIVEDECWAKLLTDAERANDTHYIEYERAALVRVDYMTQRNGLAVELNNGMATVNEVRAILNRPLFDGDEFDRPRRPANIVVEGEQPAPVGTGRRPAEPEPEDEGDEDETEDRSAVEWVVRDAARRLYHRVEAQVAKAAKAPGFACSLDYLTATYRPAFEEVMGPAVELLATRRKQPTLQLLRSMMLGFFTAFDSREECSAVCERMIR